VLEVGGEEDLDDLRATLLNARLPRLEAAWEQRTKIAARYDEAFRDLGQIYAAPPAEGVVHARQAYPIRTRKRAGVRAYLKERGVASALHVPVVTRLSFYGEYFADLELPRATALGDESLLVPVHAALTDKEQRLVIDAVLGPRSKR
jgi:dTDP-4-amino-4,6-dideoxygalactose transaminase